MESQEMHVALWDIVSQKQCAMVIYKVFCQMQWLIRVSHAENCAVYLVHTEKIVVCYDSMIFQTQPTCAIVVNDSHCICVGVFYPTTTWEKETILRNYSKQPNVSGKS